MVNYNIVLIDDLRWFKNGEEALTFRTDLEGLAWLEALGPEDTVEQLWFDHDLGPDSNGRIMDVMPIVKLLEERAFFGEAPQINHILVHTSNGVGAQSIVTALQRFFRVTRVDAKEYLLSGGIED